jgi:glycosidase
MATPRYPALYQINTRVRLNELARALGRSATLDDFSDAELDRLAALGFDWIWLLSVWQTGLAAQRISRSNPEWRREFEHTLPDLREEDIGGSGFAISDYTVHRELGGDAALARLRERLHQRGLRLMLDFVPNHMAPDHPWVSAQFFITGSATAGAAPQNYMRSSARVPTAATRTSTAGPTRCS